MSVFRALLAPIALLALMMATAPRAAAAEPFPSHPIRMVVPYPAGGGVDIAARLLAQQLSVQLGQNVLVDNRPGATGMIGSQVVAAAKPDGTTLLYAATAEAVIPFLKGGQSFDVQRELTPVTLATSTPFVLTVSPSLPVADPKELVAYAKQHPDALRWGLFGVGSPDHLAIEVFNLLAGIQPLEAPYQGGGPAIRATLSGEVTAVMGPPSLVKSYIEAGQLKGLGIGSLERSPVMPDMPTIASFGFPGYESTTWYGIWGPKGLPPELAHHIRDLVVTAQSVPAMRERMLAAALVPQGTAPEDFTAYFAAEIAKIGQLIKERGLKLD